MFYGEIPFFFLEKMQRESTDELCKPIDASFCFSQIQYAHFHILIWLNVVFEIVLNTLQYLYRVTTKYTPSHQLGELAVHVSKLLLLV